MVIDSGGMLNIGLTDCLMLLDRRPHRMKQMAMSLAVSRRRAGVQRL